MGKELTKKELNAEEKHFVDLLAHGYTLAAARNEMSLSESEAKALQERPDIMPAVRARRQELQAMRGANKDLIINIIRDTVLSDVTQIFDDDYNMKPFDEIPEHVKMCISQVEFKKSFDKLGIPVTSTKVVMMDKLKAIDMLNRLLGHYNNPGEGEKTTFTIGWKNE